MNAPTRIDPLAIPVPNIDAAIRALTALRAKPERDGYAWLMALRTFDAIEGCDALLEAIDNAESDLGLDDTELVTVRARGEGFDADQVERPGPNAVWF